MIVAVAFGALVGFALMAFIFAMLAALSAFES